MTHDFDETWYPLVFLFADYESELQITKFKIANRLRRTKMQKFTYFVWVSTNGFFKLTDNEPGVKSEKFTMADTIWQTKMEKVTCFEWKSILKGFSDRWWQI